VKFTLINTKINSIGENESEKRFDSFDSLALLLN
jgi:hypothetical protein